MEKSLISLNMTLLEMMKMKMEIPLSMIWGVFRLKQALLGSHVAVLDQEGGTK